MSIIAFTPAPWSVRATCSGHSIYGPTGKRVAYTYITSYPGAREQSEADAKLIVRAPEMQEEIDALVHDLERVMDRENCYLNALLLISKIRGRASEIARHALYGDGHSDPALASAIEARRAETAQTGSVTDESAGPKDDAPTSVPLSPIKEGSR